MVFKMIQGKILIDGLGHLEGWLHVERHAGDHAERAEAHNCAEELVSILFT